MIYTAYQIGMAEILQQQGFSLGLVKLFITNTSNSLDCQVARRVEFPSTTENLGKEPMAKLFS